MKYTISQDMLQTICEQVYSDFLKGFNYEWTEDDYGYPVKTTQYASTHSYTLTNDVVLETSLTMTGSMYDNAIDEDSEFYLYDYNANCYAELAEGEQARVFAAVSKYINKIEHKHPTEL